MTTMALGYCHRGNSPTDFHHRLLQFKNFDQDNRNLVGRNVLAATSLYVTEARNVLIQQFLASDREWLWNLDDDIWFPIDTPYILLDAADPVERPIISGMYFTMMNGKIEPIFQRMGPDGLYWPIQEFTLDQVIPIDVSGLGCMVIHRSVFEKMADNYPGPWHWFDHEQLQDRRCGEDTTFCRRAAALGFPIFGHTGVQCEHIKTIKIGILDWANSEHVKVTESGA